MGYDGSGRNVQVPSAMIQGTSGRELKSCLLRDAAKGIPARARIRYEKLSVSDDDEDLVSGTFDDFTFAGLGGWKVRIHKDAAAHHLTIL
jgi:hypothetical protein